MPVDAQRLEKLASAPAGSGGPAGDLRGQQHVVGDGQVVEQVEELEDQADGGASVAGGGGLAQPVHAGAADRDGALGGAVEAGDQVEQGRLAAAGRTEQRQAFTLGDMQAQVVEGGLVALVTAAHIYDINHGSGR